MEFVPFLLLLACLLLLVRHLLPEAMHLFLVASLFHRCLFLWFVALPSRVIRHPQKIDSRLPNVVFTYLYYTVCNLESKGYMMIYLARSLKQRIPSSEVQHLCGQQMCWLGLLEHPQPLG